MKILFVCEMKEKDLTEESYNDLNRLIRSLEKGFPLNGKNSNIKIQMIGFELNDLKTLGYEGIEPCISEITKRVDKVLSDLIVLSLRDNGDIIGPKLGTKLGRKVYLDCNDIRIKDATCLIKRKVYGGNVESLLSVGKQGIIAFSGSGSLQQDDFNTNVVTDETGSYLKWNGERIEIVKTSLETLDHQSQERSRLRKKQWEEKGITERFFEVEENEDITKAEKVIVCGYGVGSKENIDTIIEYGKSVGAVVCGTKKVTDFGWLPIHKLIGQTGKAIAPKVCLCIGVSGATPFVNGILNARKVIAINKDSEARIFKYADLGIVGDYKDFLDLETIKSLQN